MTDDDNWQEPDWDNLGKRKDVDPETGEIRKPTWDELCERGRRAQGNMDRGRWTIGDDALSIEKDYGHDHIVEYAREINVARSSVYQYRKVAAFYEKSTRVDFLAERPCLTYTHLRDAMAFGDLGHALEFLEDVAANCWTVDQAVREMNIRRSKNQEPNEDSSPNQPDEDDAPSAFVPAAEVDFYQFTWADAKGYGIVMTHIYDRAVFERMKGESGQRLVISVRKP